MFSYSLCVFCTLQRQALGLKPKLGALVAHTKAVKESVESHLSKQYDNRPVNVIGAVNTVLSG